MIKQALHRKYRPARLSELIGQEHISVILDAAISSGSIAQAYLFTGPRGTGKTSTARILGRAINCSAEPTERPCMKCDLCQEGLEGSLTDLIEIDAASHGSVDDARDLVEKARLAPTRAKKKVYIIDEVHMLTKPAFNALLKIFEEPPEHVHFILATTEAHKVLDTIKSRCQRFDFHLVSEEVLVKHLASVCEREGLTYEVAALEMIVQYARGSVRDSLSSLEQIASGRRLSVKAVSQCLGVAASASVAQLVKYLFERDVHGALDLLNRIYQEGQDVYQLVLNILEYLRILMIEEVRKPTGKQVRIFKMIEAFLKALDGLRDPVIAQLPLEIALVELCSDEDRAPVTEGERQAVTAIAESGGRSVASPDGSFGVQNSSVLKREVNRDAVDSSDALNSVVIAQKVNKPSLRSFLRMSRFERHQGGIRVLVNSQTDKKKLEEAENMQELARVFQGMNVGKVEVVVVAAANSISGNDVGSVFG